MARDPRFDGRFFIAVKTTLIYCRPICPAPSPKEQNVEYFPSAAAAGQAGYRPCLRCRPEASPGTPAWLGASATVSRALRLIAESALDESSVESLAERLGIGSRHLRNLFVTHLGASPMAIAQTRRLHFAKKLIDETDLPFTQVALASGFGSIRRFNHAFQTLYGRTPTDLRRLTRKRPDNAPNSYRFRLPYRPPYDWEAIHAFLAARAIPLVETVTDGVYARTIELNGHAGRIQVRSIEGALDLRVEFPEARLLFLIVERVRCLFDLGADPSGIDAALAADPLLAPRIAARPGLRVPGCWDSFELAVRAILGQQIQVEGAATLAGRLASAFGKSLGDGRLFPSRETLASAPLERCGLTSARADTIRAVAATGIDLEHIEELPGVGHWTAQYIAMRALGEPDAFPAGDLILQRAAGCRTRRQMEARAEAWRPWRAYAAMHLWQRE